MLIRLLVISFCIVFSSCNRDAAHPDRCTDPSTNENKRIGVWVTPEESPKARVLALYNNGTFHMIESSDVNGQSDYAGIYKKDNNSFMLYPFSDESDSPIELFLFMENEEGIQWMKSTIESKHKLYLCQNLEFLEEWRAFIQNDENFSKRVRCYRSE